MFPSFLWKRRWFVGFFGNLRYNPGQPIHATNGFVARWNLEKKFGGDLLRRKLKRMDE